MTYHLRISVLAVCCSALLLSACDSPRYRSTSAGLDIDAALQQCDRQVHRALDQLTASGGGVINTTMMPRNIAEGDTSWTCRPLCAEEWCSGFWPGILWLDYEAQLLQGHLDSAALQVRRAAIDATLAMKRVVDRPVLDHDLGFLVYCSSGTGLRVLHREWEALHDSHDSGMRHNLYAENAALIPQLRDLCLRAADSLSTLFNPTVGTILSWPRNVGMFGGHNTIMDNMINLELLCWAAEERSTPDLEEEGERLYSLPEESPLHQMAVRHAQITLRHHFRPDGTSYHVAVYDTLDGHFIHGVTHQGLNDSSTWARGQAWAIYGFTMMARETADGNDVDNERIRRIRGRHLQEAEQKREHTGEHKLFRHAENKKIKDSGSKKARRLNNEKVRELRERERREQAAASLSAENDSSTSAAFLRMACTAADAFIGRLPEDGIPYWDFDDPRIITSPATPAAASESVAPRDASAAAVVASALLELCTLVADEDIAGYYYKTAIRILKSLASEQYQAGEANCAFLLHSTGNLPAGSEIDIPIIYADYYYLEALIRLKALK